MNNKHRMLIIFLFSILMLPLVTSPVMADSGMPYFELSEFEHGFAQDYFTMKDLKDESIVMMTGRIINVGDEFITGNNLHYVVERVEDTTAWARSLGQIELSDPPQVQGIFQSGMLPQSGVLPPAAIAQGNNLVTIAVFHSHGAEAFVPSEGTESVPDGGGIVDVTQVFAGALQNNGLPVLHSQELHVPHDAGAYHRSRRTKKELMGGNADVFFDLHRDAVPAEEYKEIVEGEPTVQIMFVVGRQNPNVSVNRSFAESLKKATDRLYPGLIKGIFMARGNYNQDMSPLSLLLETGTYQNTKEGAKRSVTLFADAVKYYFAGPEGAMAQRAVGGTALRIALWIILIVPLAAAAYLLISTRSIEEARARITSFYRKEFAEFKARRRGDPGKG